MNKVFSIGIVGGGIDSEIGLTHINSILLSKKFRIVAGVFSKNKKQNYLSAKKYNVKKFYSSHKDLLKREKLDAVVLLTPFINRIEILREILKKNIPVIAEKPLVSSLSEAKKLKKISNKNLIISTYNYIGYPMVRELRFLNQKKFFGKINKIFIEMPSGAYLHKKSKVTKWRLKDKVIPGVYLDLGSHILSLINFITDSLPQKFFKISSSDGKYNKVVDDFMSIGYLKNKIKFNIWFSKSAIGYDNGLKIRIFGSKASCEWVQNNPENLKIKTNDKKYYVIDRGSYLSKISKQKRYNNFKPGHPSGFQEAFANLYDDIYEVLKKYFKGKNYKNNYVMDLEKSIQILKVLDMFKKSPIIK